MTQRAINLYDGLEALYYFDSDYYDGTTGEIKDKSGHGRHATASGAPTVGVNGPNDFEAANFSGFNSGDSFVINGPDLTGDFTVAALIQYGDGGNRDHFNISPQSGENYPSLNSRNGDKLRFEHFDANGDFETLNIFGHKTDKWYLHAVRYTESSELVENISVTKGEVRAHSNGIENTPSIRVIGNSDWDNGIALSGVWSRTVSDVELEQLNDLTAPRRAQL